MTKRAVKRIIKKKRQLKKQVKHSQQTQQKQMPMVPLGFGYQMYGNADGTMQQLRNQNQTTIDQINSMTSALRSLQNENKKNESLINELKKQHKEAEHGRDKAKIDLEIAEDKARDIDMMMKQRAYYIDKQQQIEKDLLGQNGEKNRLQQMSEIEEQKHQLHVQQMKAIKQKQEIDSNKLYAELEQTKEQITLIQSQNEAYLRRISSEELQNPAAYLPKVLANKLKAKEQSELVKKAYELAEQSKPMNDIIDKGYDIDSKEMIEQITNRIIKQDEMNELLKDEKRTYDNAIYEYEHLQEVERKAKIIQLIHNLKTNDWLLKLIQLHHLLLFLYFA